MLCVLGSLIAVDRRWFPVLQNGPTSIFRQTAGTRWPLLLLVLLQVSSIGFCFRICAQRIRFRGPTPSLESTVADLNVWMSLPYSLPVPS